MTCCAKPKPVEAEDVTFSYLFGVEIEGPTTVFVICDKCGAVK